MKQLIDELFNPHIDLCKQTFEQIKTEWGYSSATLNQWLKSYHPELLNKEYSRKAGLNADIFLPYRKGAFWSGSDAISRLKLAVKAEVVIIFSNPDLNELQQKDLYINECLRLWTRINSTTTSLSYKQFIELLNKCYNEVIDNWEDEVEYLLDKQEEFKFKRKQTLYHYNTRDFDNIYSFMTLSEAYNDWLKYKFPNLLDNYKATKRREFALEALTNEWSDELKEAKYNQLNEDLKLIKIKEPTIQAFRKLLTRNNIEYKKNSSRAK